MPQESAEKLARLVEKWCATGQRADDSLRAGKIDEALAVHKALVREIDASGMVDTLPLAKSVLSQLLCHVLKDDMMSAHHLWTKDRATDDSLEALGIWSLENGQTEPHDLMIYFMICARLYSVAVDNRAQAAEAVNRYMISVCQYSCEEDPSMLPTALSNWQAFLTELSDGGTIPGAWQADLQEITRKLGIKVTLGPVTFPSPRSWNLGAPSGTLYGPDGSITSLG